MEELKNQLIAKLGIEPDKAHGVVEMVINFIKDKLPEGLHGTIDSALHGEGGAGDLLEQAKSMLGGLFK